ncbi:unnamed protein product [Cercospora beticola]|nr:unnamed protein product [Cercospora beticola]
MQQRRNRAVRSLVTSSQLYSVPERPGGPVPSSIYSFDNVSKSSKISTDTVSTLPPAPPPKSPRRSFHPRGHVRTGSQLNTHLAHLFGAPCGSHRDSIDSLTESYGRLAWDPEDLQRRRPSTSTSPTPSSSSTSSSASSSSSCWNSRGRKKQRDLVPCKAALDDLKDQSRSKGSLSSSSDSGSETSSPPKPLASHRAQGHGRKASNGGTLLLKMKNGKVCVR